MKKRTLRVNRPLPTKLKVLCSARSQTKQYQHKDLHRRYSSMSPGCEEAYFQAENTGLTLGINGLKTASLTRMFEHLIPLYPQRIVWCAGYTR